MSIWCFCVTWNTEYVSCYTSMEHVKNPLSLITLSDKIDNYFATYTRVIYSYTCSYIHWHTHWEFCVSLHLCNSPWDLPNAGWAECRAQPPYTWMELRIVKHIVWVFMLSLPASCFHLQWSGWSPLPTAWSTFLCFPPPTSLPHIFTFCPEHMDWTELQIPAHFCNPPLPQAGFVGPAGPESRCQVGFSSVQTSNHSMYCDKN